MCVLRGSGGGEGRGERGGVKRRKEGSINDDVK